MNIRQTLNHAVTEFDRKRKEPHQMTKATSYHIVQTLRGARLVDSRTGRQVWSGAREDAEAARLEQLIADRRTVDAKYDPIANEPDNGDRFW